MSAARPIPERVGRGRRPLRRAFTVLEAIVALVIAGAGFGAITTGLVQSKRAESRAAEAAHELSIARALLEEAFVNALPPDQRTHPAQGVDLWTGVREGLAWKVEVHSIVMRGQDWSKTPDEIATLAALASDDPGAGAPLIPMDLVRVEVGRVTLSTARW